MMDFLKTFLAALLAVIVANIIAFVFLIFIFAGFAVALGGNSTTVEISKNSVLMIDLGEGIVDSPPAYPLTYSLTGGLQVNRANTVYQAVSAIDRAVYDDRIKGIYLSVEGGSASGANLEEMRDALQRFSDSGKFIISYSDSYSQMGYWFSSVADKVLLNPEGQLEWQGLSASVMFYKGLLDKLGVRVEVIRHGEYKAAVEPYIMQSMSPENRLQMNAMVNAVWGNMLTDVSFSRGIDSSVLSNYATELSVYNPAMALEYGMVDALVYEDQVMELLGRMSEGYISADDALGVVTGAIDREWTSGSGDYDAGEWTEEWSESFDTGDFANDTEQEDTQRPYVKYGYSEPAFVSLPDYITAHPAHKGKLPKSKVAVIYADGEIVDGESYDGTIGGATIAAKLAEARQDYNTKAVVLRINSPGGSALASEVIWREMERLKEEKPVIVSMGATAASGGYYIAAPADIILANQMTITGSIGVFGLMLDISGGLRDKLGVSVDVARTNPSADMGSIYRPMSPNERRVMTNEVERVYNTFAGHVADGRNLSFEQVDAIGGGRVWAGANAFEIGLIDGYGGIKEAIELAADRAGLRDDYHVWELTDNVDNLSVILRSLVVKAGMGSMKTDGFAEETAEYIKSVERILSTTGVQARMPETITLE